MVTNHTTIQPETGGTESHAIHQRSGRNGLCCEGPEPRSRADSRRGKMDPGQRNQRHFRLYPRYRLVRSPAGRLQAEPEREGRRDPGSAGGDHRLLRYDAFRRHGERNPARQDDPGSAEHRPGVRRHQHRHARAVPADRVRPDRKTWARACVPWWVPCTAPRKRAPVIWR